MKRHYLFSYCNIDMLIVIVLFSRERIRVKRLLDLRGLNRLANWKRTKKAFQEDTSSSVCIWKPHRILARAFSTNLTSISHFDLSTSKPYSYSATPDAWLWHSICGLPAPNLRFVVMCERSQGHLCTAFTCSLFWCGRSQPLWFLCSELVPLLHD